MRLHLVCVGRLQTEYAKAGCEHYLRRVRHPFEIEVTEVREPRRTKGGSVDAWRAAEADAIRAAVGRGAWLVVLDERGRQWTSRELAEWVGVRRDESVREVALVIGGPDGLEPALRAEARRVWSLGKLTLPHELARVVLCEQLYRAVSILSGSPYHRD